MSHRSDSTVDDKRAHKVNMRESRFLYGHPVDVAGTGFTVLDRVYADGDLADETLGGSCGNILVSLAMLHRRVAPVLALGDDDAGEMAEMIGQCVGMRPRIHDFRIKLLRTVEFVHGGGH